MISCSKSSDSCPPEASPFAIGSQLAGAAAASAGSRDVELRGRFGTARSGVSLVRYPATAEHSDERQRNLQHCRDFNHGGRAGAQLQAPGTTGVAGREPGHGADEGGGQGAGDGVSPGLRPRHSPRPCASVRRQVSSATQRRRRFSARSEPSRPGSCRWSWRDKALRPRLPPWPRVARTGALSGCQC